MLAPIVGVTGHTLEQHATDSCSLVVVVTCRYGQGVGVERDQRRALELLEHACDKRHNQSCMRAAEVSGCESVGHVGHNNDDSESGDGIPTQCVLSSDSTTTGIS